MLQSAKLELFPTNREKRKMNIQAHVFEVTAIHLGDPVTVDGAEIRRITIDTNSGQIVISCVFAKP
jgi:hypothetical protein